MKILKIADKLISHLYKEFLQTGETVYSATECLQIFPKEKPHSVFTAIRLLCTDGYVSVLYGDDEPDTLALEITAIERCESNILMKKGYVIFKEVLECVGFLR